MVAWNCRRYFNNHYFLFVGIAYLFVGILTLVHAFSYEGMNLMPGFGANAPTQIWIAMRYVASLTLLVAPLTIRRRIRPGLIFGGYSLIALFLLLSILCWRIFPACFLENAGGLTPFKKISEYIISMILIASSALIVYLRRHFDPSVLRWLLLSIASSVVSELSFTAYASVYGFSNLVGHYFEIISFYFMYKAVIETGLAKPYDLLFRDLNRQREWLRVTLGSIGDAVIAADLDGRITFMNSMASKLTTWEPPEAMGRPVANVLQIFNESSREPAEDITAHVLKQRHALRMADHTTLINRDGCEIPIEDSAAPIKDGAGNIIGAVIVFRDVTEKRQAQNRLLESEQRYRDLAEELEVERSKLAAAIANMPVGFGIGDKSGTILLMNHMGLQLHGFESEAEMRSSLSEYLPLFELRHPDGQPISPEQWPLARALRGEFVQDCELILRNKFREEERVCSYSTAPVGNGNGGVNLIVYTIQDITESKQAQQVLQRSIDKFELLSNTAARLLAAEDPQNVVQELCREVMAFLDCQIFLNFLFDKRTARLRLNSYTGIPASEAHKIQWQDCGRIVRGRQLIIDGDYANTFDIRAELVKSYGIRAYCCHPLLIRDRLIGTLSFGTKTRSHFTSEEIGLMRTVANNVALAIQRIQVQEKLKNVNKELEQKVLERTEELANNYERLSLANAQLKVRADQLRRLASELTMAEQRERKRLSKVLHDGLQQHLATAKLQIGHFADTLQDHDGKREAAEIEALLSESIQMSRSLSVELSPPVLHEAGIAGALKWLARWMREKHDVNVDLTIDGHPQLPEDVSVLVFESVRELLFNTAKHAKVSRAAVSLRQGGDSKTQIVVSDQGAGFDPSLLNSIESVNGGLGLFSIRERIDSIGGCF